MRYIDIRNWSIRNKIMAVCILCMLIPMLITTSLFYTKANKIVDEEISNYTSQMLNQVITNVEKNLSDAERISMSPYSNMQVLDVMAREVDVANGTQLLQDRQIMTNFLSGILNVKGDFLGVTVFTQNNENYSLESLNEEYTYKNQAWYKQLSEGEKEWVIFGPHTPEYKYRKDQEVISFIRRIKRFSGSNSIIAYLVIDINYNSIRDMCSKASFGENGRLYVIDENSRVVYDKDSSNIGLLLEKKDNDYRIANKVIHNTSKQNSLISEATSPYSNWKYICINPTNETASNFGQIIRYTIIVGLICMLIAIILSILLSYAITRPIKKLTQVMKTVETGNLDVSFGYSFRDEIGVLSTGFNNMITNMKDLLKRVLDFRLKTKEAELESLQSKINPHFLYNTLQSIQMKAVLDGNEKLAEMVELLGNYMRFSISSMKEIITFKKEMEYLEIYINLQKIRFGDKLNYKCETTKEAEQCKIMKLVLQPIVENAIYHGLEKKVGDWTITLNTYVEDDRLHINITDNGVGLSKKELEDLKHKIFSDEQNQSSIGLKNVYQRLKLVFDDLFEFKVDSIQNLGTNIEICIPAIYEEELDIFKGDKKTNKI